MQHIVCIITLECKSDSVVAVVHDTVLESAGGSYYRNCSVSCRDHLSKSAGLALRWHKEHIGACVQSLCKTGVEYAVLPNNFTLKPVHVLEELLILALARTENHYLHVCCDYIVKYCANKVESLVVSESGDHGQQRYLIFRHAEFIENRAFAGSLALVILRAEISGDGSIGFRIVHIRVDTVKESTGLVLLAYQDSVKSVREPRIQNFLCIGGGYSSHLVSDLDSALHEVDVAIVFNEIYLVRRDTYNILHQIKAILALIADIVNCKHMLDVVIATAGITVEKILFIRYERALPVNGVNDLRLELDIFQHFEHCTAKEHITFCVVEVSVKSVIALEIELVVDEEIGNAINLLGEKSAILASPADRNGEIGYVIHLFLLFRLE